MSEVKLTLDEDGRGAFELIDNGETIGEMVISVRHNNLIAHHTGIVVKLRGKGYADQLFDEMVTYSRKNGLRVISRCAYVDAQFKRHPKQYEDIWVKN
jgi:uncharacterized protein